ncbi:D-alanyl-D-alanine carboxypeptidase DacB precursor [Clostridium sp. C105KSO15]|nr:D-alanyl-D-alanine carboxypeptidase DacB precursor [Clostridium sp. C105KSO15]
MAKKSCRLWSLVISISILASIPSYGEMPLIQPFPGATGQTGTGSGPSGGTAGEIGPGVGAGTGAGSTQTGDLPNAGGTNAGGTLPADIKQPVIQSEGAVLMDASTGTLLFSKNGETRYYPASITKLMTALLVAEKCNLSETVTFSKAATTNLESGAVTLGLTEGDKLTVEQSLYGLMLKSANEVANGLAEHVSGSVSAFSALMNARAKELGCTGTNFVNPNGLNSTSHYTTPHDMALIARAAYQNDTVKKISSTLNYQIPATKKASARTVTMGHKMLNPGDSRYYPGVIGGKTGFTSLAGNTLVTCVEQNGVRLIAVIMKSKSTHYEDTKSLLDYGFALKAAGGTVQASSQGWVQEGAKWYYRKQDGNKASNEWQNIGGVYYWFDTDSYMAASRWVESNGKWFYLGSSGAMLKDTTTPDGYRLDSSGAWIR